MYPDFYKAVEQWLYRLQDLIIRLEEDGNNVLLIAISRKMPRIFEWLDKSWPCGKGVCENSRLALDFIKNKHELVSEHAIPFILTDDDAVDKEIIVIDDIIIRGTSMAEVSADIHAYSKKKPYVSTIFVSEGISADRFPYARFEHIDNVPVVKENDIKSVVNEFCKCIKDCALPMELEFPIFHLSESYDTLKECLHKRAKQLNFRNYVIDHICEFPSKKHDTISENFSVLLENESRWTLNHDYAKVRLFEKECGAALEISSPRVIPVTFTNKSDLFTEEPYSKLWNKILNKIAPEERNSSVSISNYNRVEDKKQLTLAVWANYLFSFSVGMNECVSTTLFKDFPADPKVNRSDVALIVGAGLADEITNDLNDLALNRVVEPRLVEKYHDTQMFVSDESVREEYEDQRMYASLNSSSLKDALEYIFAVHQTPGKLNPDFSERVLSQIPKIGETISSLEALLDFKFNSDGDNYVTRINRELDCGVDEGKISPFYEKVKDVSGLLCWRRFYRGGSNSIS